MRHDWANTRGIFTGGKGGFSPDALKIFSSPFSFFVTIWNPGWTYAPGQYAALLRSAFGGSIGMNIINVISGGLTVCLVLGLIQITLSALKNRTMTLRETVARPPTLLTVLFLLLVYLAFGLVAGKPFHARYCMLVLPLIFTLAGAGAAQCFQSPRLKMFLLPLLVITITADLWFMPVICRFEGERIANGPTFVPSFAKMDSIYRQLNPRANVSVVVRDSDYIAAIAPGEKYNYLRHARVFSHYVHARELELLAAGKVSTQTNYFDLRAIDLVNTNDPAVAYSGNGIALVAVPQ